MIKPTVIVGGGAVLPEQAHFLPKQSGLSPFAAGKKGQADGVVGLVPQKAHLLNLHPMAAGTAASLRKPLRAVFRDSSFASSPSKINVFEIFKLYMPEDADDISKRVRVI